MPIVWTERFPRREKLRGYLRLLRARQRFFDYYAPPKLRRAGSHWHFGPQKMPGYNRKLAQLRDRHRGERCFVIGNGPSLKGMDLSGLASEVTIGSNGIYQQFEQWGFATDYLLFEDIEQTELRRRDIASIHGTTKLSGLHNAYAFRADDETIFMNIRLADKRYWAQGPQFSEDFSHLVHLGSTVTYIALQLAFHLGCDPVYVIGVDHDYGLLPKLFPPGKVEIDEDNLELVRGLHFSDGYYEEGDLIGVPHVQLQDAAYAEADRAFRRDGRRVYNAGSRSKVAAFERCDFDSLFPDGARAVARARERFEASIETSLCVDELADLATARCNGQASLAAPDTGRGVVLEASGDDPIVWLPPTSLPAGQSSLLELEIEAPCATELEVFLPDEDGRYARENVVSRPLAAGPNSLLVELPSFASQHPLRFDPGKAPGTYHLGRLALRVPEAAEPNESSAFERVLFITNDAGQYGAPMSLLYLVRQFRRLTSWEIRIVVREPNGTLIPRFEGEADTHVFLPKGGEPQEARARLEAWLDGWRPDLVYSNTAMNGDVTACFDEAIPVVTHVRELEWYLSTLDAYREEAFRKRPELYFAVSEAVRENLAENHAIDRERVEIAPAAIDAIEIQRLRGERTREQIRKELDIPRDAVVAGAVARVDRRKGCDLFLEAAERALGECDAPLYFVWVGTGPEETWLREQIEARGLADRFRMPGRRDNPYPYFAAMDVYVMSSRDDPCPRVNLEAGLLGVPVVTFEGTGGSAEVVANGAGIAVAHLDTNALADAVARLATEPEERARLGLALQRKVLEGFEVEAVAARVLAMLEERVGPRSASAQCEDLREVDAA